MTLLIGTNRSRQLPPAPRASNHQSTRQAQLIENEITRDRHQFFRKLGQVHKLNYRNTENRHAQPRAVEVFLSLKKHYKYMKHAVLSFRYSSTTNCSLAPLILDSTAVNPRSSLRARLDFRNCGFMKQMPEKNEAK